MSNKEVWLQLFCAALSGTMPSSDIEGAVERAGKAADEAAKLYERKNKEDPTFQMFFVGPRR